ncbi:MAG: hypothetical protein NVS3B19_19830 [Ginsengibacter sp.]
MEIKYSIKYSSRKTINIIIERDRSVVVRAPLNTSEEFIAKEVNKKRQLLQEKISHNQKYPFPKPIKQFVSGETLLYLWKHYKLYITNNPEEGVSFDNKFFIGKSNQKKANELFREWYINSASKIIVSKAKDCFIINAKTRSNAPAIRAQKSFTKSLKQFYRR